jgi:cardiolipin synthase
LTREMTRDMQSEIRLLTISNIITLSRLVMLPFIVYFLVMRQVYIAFSIMLLSLLSDAVDGFLARKLHQESEAGKFLDPLCDKISLIVILITLFLIGSIPLWGLIIIILRDVLILIGSLVLITKKAMIFKSNFVGKITGFIFGAVILAYTINLKQLGDILMYIAIPVILISFIIYLNRYIKAMKGAG